MSKLMMERSGKGAYANLVQTLVKTFDAEFNKGGDSEPKVITDLIFKAVRARKPKTCYAAGKYSGSLLFIRKWFSDRTFDKAIMSMVKK